MTITFWTASTSAVATTFLASLVEAVEAFTILLAVGTVRGWRPSLLGAASGIAVLALLVVVLGPLFYLVPLQLFQLIVGILLLLFGMRWLRKAIMRAAGVIAFHDENQTLAAETAGLRWVQHNEAHLDWFAGLTAFKAVLLEGIEIVFIVIAVGVGQGLLLPAAIGAVAACAIVGTIGLAVHRPLARVPENTLKFAVGVLLSAFGLFWVGEGLGIAWPGEDFAILALALMFLSAGLAFIRFAVYIRNSRLG